MLLFGCSGLGSGTRRCRLTEVETPAENVDGSEVALAPGQKVAMGKATRSTEGNGHLAGATVHQAHLMGAPGQMVVMGGRHLQIEPLRTSPSLETSTTEKSAALCSLAALFSWRVSGQFANSTVFSLSKLLSFLSAKRHKESIQPRSCVTGQQLHSATHHKCASVSQSLVFLLIESPKMFIQLVNTMKQ